MTDGPLIASIAALIGDPARANMLTMLMDGRALTVSELAGAGGVGLPTASGHLAKLEQSGLLVAQKQGRHRYFRLSGADVAQVLEGLMGLAQHARPRPVRTGPRDQALRAARVCYDHLAGERAVGLMSGLLDRGLIVEDDALRLTGKGRDFFAGMGIETAPLERGRRPVCRTCLDWSERRGHLGGALGAAVLSHILAQRWARRSQGRAVHFSAEGARAFDGAFGLNG